MEKFEERTEKFIDILFSLCARLGGLLYFIKVIFDIVE